MKVDILTRHNIKKIIDEIMDKRESDIYRELNKLRAEIRLLNDEIRCKK